MVRIGTSGFSYKEWCGSFYPPRTPGSRMLSFYGQRLATVEINYTFRAMPRPQMLAGWAQQTPANFRFALKAPQRITHIARLRGVGAELEHFAAVAQSLESRLGPSLFQLPPTMKADVPLLAQFVTQLSSTLPAAFEFRHPSWLQDVVFATLKEAGCALCIAQSDSFETPVVKTADFAYLRLRRESYSDEELRRWAQQLAALDQSGDVYVYLKHEVQAPALAQRLSALVQAQLS
ncbi:MAG TPA: DUF72 domain-containing protein [Candidatus Binataceae bacterium]|nr:DUF72 domain-containing protein [Candidatus Binataceae bacterium]